MNAYLDTQVFIWLCQNQLDRLTPAARRTIEQTDLLVSPMVLLELEYLYEIGRLLQPPHPLLAHLQKQIGLRVCDYPFASVIETALFETWTRDPFDRVIAAHAKASNFSPLVTSDPRIRQQYPRAVW